MSQEITLFLSFDLFGELKCITNDGEITIVPSDTGTLLYKVVSDIKSFQGCT